MKIKAAVLDEMGLARPYGKTRPLDVQILDLEDTGPGEVLVKMAAAGLCHSDLSVIGFRARILSVSARFKLGQDEMAETFARIVASLGDEDLKYWMTRMRHIAS